MGKTISEPKNVQMVPGSTKGIKKMQQKRVVADFGTYTKIVNALSTPGVHKDSTKSQAGDKNVAAITKSTDSLTESIITFGTKHGFDKLIEALDSYGGIDQEEAERAKPYADEDMSKDPDIVSDEELEFDDLPLPELTECGDKEISEDEEPIEEKKKDDEDDKDEPIEEKKKVTKSKKEKEEDEKEKKK